MIKDGLDANTPIYVSLAVSLASLVVISLATAPTRPRAWMRARPGPGRLSFHQAGARHDFHARKLQALRERFGGANEAEIHDPHFRAIAANVINDSGTRMAPYAGMPTLLDAPARAMDWSRPEFGDLEVALLGVPMDLGASNRSGCRFGPPCARSSASALTTTS